MKAILILFPIALVAVLVIIGPLLLICSLNTLFPMLGIPSTWGTYFAAFFLMLIFAPMKKIKSN